jgi:hypothetical protein
MSKTDTYYVLSCFAVNNTDARIYYKGLSGSRSTAHVHELAWTGSEWATSDLGAEVDGLSPLACYGVNNTDARVYYLDFYSHVHELAWTGSKWNASDLTDLAGASPSFDGGVLACYGVNNTDARVYYLGRETGHVHELAWTGSKWNPSDLTDLAGASNPSEGSGLACYGVNNTDARVYYLASDGHVIELAWTGSKWQPSDLTARTGASPGDPFGVGRPMACYGVNNTDARVYYLGQDNGHVHELAWTGSKWQPSDLTARTGAPSPDQSSPLACFGVNNTDARVYYLASDGHVIELAWTGSKWVWRDITVDAGAVVGDPGSPLACFGVNQTDARIYYLNQQALAVGELAWTGSSWKGTSVIGINE